MTQLTQQFSADPINLDFIDCPEDPQRRENEITYKTSHYAATYVISGQLTIRRCEESWNFGPGDVVLFYPNTVQSISHPDSEAKTLCLSLRFGTVFLENILGTLPAFEKNRYRSRSAATAFNLWRLTEAIKRSDHRAIENVAFVSAGFFGTDMAMRTTWTSVDRNFLWYRLRVQRACEYINEHPTEKCGLIDLSNLTGLSPFHFARVFQYFVGLSSHRYVSIARLAKAANALRDGQSISYAAYHGGFTSLSYFSRAFRKHFGKPPSDFRNNLSCRTLKETTRPPLPERNVAFTAGFG